MHISKHILLSSKHDLQTAKERLILACEDTYLEFIAPEVKA
jgi:hypothetical protein